jgi:hypothetical protein
VTAEHLLEWCYPGNHRAGDREKAHREKWLRVAWHVASGAKHLELHDGRHTSVDNVDVQMRADATAGISGFMPGLSLPGGGPPPGRTAPYVVITLDDGVKMRAIDIACWVLDYWREALT